MKTEIEAKFLNIDHDDMRSTLQKAGGRCVAPMHLMRRVLLDSPYRRLIEQKHTYYLRLRDEGDKVTLTFKQFTSSGVEGAQEIGTEVGSFDTTIELFEAIGLEVKSFQESKRETWMLEECEVVLDVWPWLNPYIEIEGGSSEAVEACAQKLGLDWSDAVFGDAMAAYRVQYPHLLPHETIADLKEVRFGMPVPELLQRR